MHFVGEHCLLIILDRLHYQKKGEDRFFHLPNLLLAFTKTTLRHLLNKHLKDFLWRYYSIPQNSSQFPTFTAQMQFSNSKTNTFDVFPWLHKNSASPLKTTNQHQHVTVSISPEKTFVCLFIVHRFICLKS